MFKSSVSILLAVMMLSFSTFGQERGKATGITKQIPADMTRLISKTVQTGDKNADKVDPLLRYFIRNVKENRNVSQREVIISKLSEVASVESDVYGEIRVSVLIKTGNVNTTIANIEGNNGWVSTIAGNILTAALPLTAIETIADLSETHSIQVSAKSKSLMNASHVEIKANQVHTGIGLPQGYRGEGVVVGVLDSGIDWSHENFDAPNNTTRIQYLWDMSGNGNPPAGYTYGTEYTKTQIDAGQCLEIDGNGSYGHGTHVAGTAAGNGNGNPGGYTGVAPAADIVFVKGIRDHNSNGGFADADVVDGVNYIFSKAAAMGKPAVVNLSLGGHFGAHDGSSLYEQALDFLTGPGKIIVAAAGNEGSDYIHGGYATQAGSSYNDALETIWVTNPNSTIMVTDMWYNSGNISVGIAAYDTLFGSLIAFTDAVAPGQFIENVPISDGFTTYGLVSIDATTLNDPNNNARRVLFLVSGENGAFPIDGVYWSIYTFSASGSPTFDMWSVAGGYFTTDSGGWFRPGDNDKSVGMPATANDIISVGSYVTKNQWVDIDGILRQQLNPGGIIPTIGQLSYFSSHGPSRDGRLKPQISAPGEAILSALSGNLTIGVGVLRQNILLGGRYQKQQGTSMASPHITGTVALMLQRNHSLNVNEVLAILSGTARKDGFTGNNVNNLFGHGKVDALAAVQNVPTGIEPVEGEIPTNYELEQNFPNPFNPVTHIRFAVPRNGRITLTIFNVLGQRVAVLADEMMAAGQYIVDFDASELTSGIYFYQIEAEGFKQVKKMLLTR